METANTFTCEKNIYSMQQRKKIKPAVLLDLPWT